jgi:hypothetical protein
MREKFAKWGNRLCTGSAQEMQKDRGQGTEVRGQKILNRRDRREGPRMALRNLYLVGIRCTGVERIFFGGFV